MGYGNRNRLSSSSEKIIMKWNLLSTWIHWFNPNPFTFQFSLPLVSITKLLIAIFEQITTITTIHPNDTKNICAFNARRGVCFTTDYYPHSIAIICSGQIHEIVDVSLAGIELRVLNINIMLDAMPIMPLRQRYFGLDCTRF